MFVVVWSHLLFFFFQYYFGDYNLGKDKYLQEVVKEDDGCILLLSLTFLSIH